MPLDFAGALVALMLSGGCAYSRLPVSPQAEATVWHQFDCLDLAASFRSHPDFDSRHLVMAVWFGNRCTTPVPMDLSAISVVAHMASGETVRLGLDDPRHQIRPLHLEASGHDGEAILLTPARRSGSRDEIVEICVDLHAVGSTQSQQPTAPPACIAHSRGTPWPAVTQK
jgi:hypothetical protein